MKKTIGILAIALLIGMVLPAAAQTAQADGSASNDGTLQTAQTDAAAEGTSTVAQSGSTAQALAGFAASSSASDSVPGTQDASTSAIAAGSGGTPFDAATSAYGVAVGNTASAGPGNTFATGNDEAQAFSSSFAGSGSFTDISGNTYTGNQADNEVFSVAGSNGLSESSNSAQGIGP